MITDVIIIPENAIRLATQKDWMHYTYQLHHRDDDPMVYENSPTHFPCYAVISDLREGSGRHLRATFQFYYVSKPLSMDIYRQVTITVRKEETEFVGSTVEVTAWPSDKIQKDEVLGLLAAISIGISRNLITPQNNIMPFINHQKNKI